MQTNFQMIDDSGHPASKFLPASRRLKIAAIPAAERSEVYGGKQNNFWLKFQHPAFT
jgi:hypothetical protein